MQRLFSFIFKYRAFFVFFSLEFLCLILIYSKNDYQKTTFVNSSSSVVGSLLTTKRGVVDYFALRKQNKKLAEENSKLKELILKNNALSTFISKNYKREIDKYRLYSAKVVNNSVSKQNNYITINLGEKDGITKGMGVMNEEGVVGIVISTSLHYSLVASILHSQSMISARIKNTNTIGTAHWSGEFTHKFELNYIPRHIELNLNDTVVTSSFNAIFPENIPIGTIEYFELKENGSFYEVDLKLLPNIANLDYVYVVENIFRDEQKGLEQMIHNE